MTEVLIAEDNAVNRELLHELLETGGYEVLEACDGQQALHMIEQTQPDILVLNIGMPVLDGFGVIRKIRENSCLATVPVLAVTAYAMQGDREKIMKSGFNGYLSKPVDARSLAEELNRLLSKRDDRNSPPDQSNESQPDGRVRAAASSGNRSSRS
jgi:two-component system cell cycle response regulator DivK